jgi:hypothetical protein
MTQPPRLTIVPSNDGHDVIADVKLILTRAVHVDRHTNDRYKIGADALVTLANGDVAAALGAALSSLLDLMAFGEPIPASEALGISGELAHRMVKARAELRTKL